MFKHTLGPDASSYDTPNFRAHIGGVLQGTTVTARVDIGIDNAPLLVGAQNQMQGVAVVCGYPYPVPTESRILPLFPPA